MVVQSFCGKDRMRIPSLSERSLKPACGKNRRHKKRRASPTHAASLAKAITTKKKPAAALQVVDTAPDEAPASSMDGTDAESADGGVPVVRAAAAALPNPKEWRDSPRRHPLLLPHWL